MTCKFLRSNSSLIMALIARLLIVSLSLCKTEPHGSCSEKNSSIGIYGTNQGWYFFRKKTGFFT